MKVIIHCNERDCLIMNSCLKKDHGVADNICGFSELHFIAYHNDLKKAEDLILNKDVNINCKNKCGKTPLLIAIQNWNIEIAEILLNSGANVNIPDDKGNSPLQTAINANDDDVINLLTAYCMGA